MTRRLHYSKGSPTLSYIDIGDGPTLLLLHGVTRGWADWQSLLPSLAKRWRVVAIDQRGHGVSGRANSYFVTDYVADVVPFVRDEIASPLVIFGHSLGAMVAAAVASQLPEQVRGVVLEDPPFHTMGNRIASSSWQTLFTGMRQVARGGGTIPTLIDELAEIRLPVRDGEFVRLGDLRDRESLAWSAECLQHLDPEVLTPVIEACWLKDFDVEKVLAQIGCPTLLLQGDPTAGGALTDADAEAAMAVLSVGTRVCFTGVGHQLHATCPEEVLSAFQEFAVIFATDGRTKLG